MLQGIDLYCWLGLDYFHCLEVTKHTYQVLELLVSSPLGQLQVTDGERKERYVYRYVSFH